MLCVATSRLMRRLKVDDVVDAFAVHGACGIWGMLAPGFFGGAAVGGNGVPWLRRGGVSPGRSLLSWWPCGAHGTAHVGHTLIFVPERTEQACEEHGDVRLVAPCQRGRCSSESQV